MIPPEFLNAIATQQGVSKSELAALQLALEGHSTADIGVQLGIRGDAVRKRLSEVYHKFSIAGRGPVKLTKLQQLLVTRYQESLTDGILAVDLQDTGPVDWGNAPDVSVFYGRISELAKLEKWIIQDHYRLMAIYGIAGIGKSTLSVKLTQRLQPHFEKVFWRSLYHAPLLQDLLPEIITFFDPSQSDNVQSVPEQIDWVMQYLQQHRCLLVFNGMEALCRSGDLAGNYQPNYENYSQFINLVGTMPHQSCLLTTSQDKISEVAYLEGQTLPVGSFKLRGLEEEDAKTILRNKGLTGEKKWPYLVNGYRGNPMMLKLVAETIKEVFDGNVSDFLDTSLFTSDIHNFVERIFDRVSDLEKQILYILSDQSQGLNFKQLQIEMDTVTPQDLMGALSSLRQRSLVEHVDQGFILPPVIKEVTQQIMAS